MIATVLFAAVGLTVATSVTGAQGSASASGNGSASTAGPSGDVAGFRKSFVVSVEGSAWGATRTVALPATRCVPANTSPCAPGTPALIVNVRFAALPGAVDLAKVLAQLGESGGQGNRYMVRPVPSNAAGTVCGGGISVAGPLGNMRLAINLGDPGTPLPVTCRWAVVAGIPNGGSSAGFDVIWSDTVLVQVVPKL